MARIFGHCDNCRVPPKIDPPELADASPALSSVLHEAVREAIKKNGGWIGFDAFMSVALYAPGLGYYAKGSAQFGMLPADALKHSRDSTEGSDFATAPEMTPLFGQTLATQVAEALQATGTCEVWEFGAGTGALALQILNEMARLQVPISRYTIVDVSGALRARQQQRLKAHGDAVRWVDALPAQMQGVVIGNEVLDAMPVKLLVRKNRVWFERGVALETLETFETVEALGALETFETFDSDAAEKNQPRLIWSDRETDLRPPVDIPGPHDYLTEIHPQSEAFVRTLADKLTCGAAFFLDYGFPEAEYYHPQRHMGTVMCHRQHRSDANPLSDVGLKDITAHVNFTGIALAGQDAGLDVLGYCTQARFLINCGLLARLENASLQDKVMAQKLIMEHEMGELFKVIGFYKPCATSTQKQQPSQPWQPVGFARGDRTHML